MLDEIEIVRKAFFAPVEDPEARDRALARLREAMGVERPSVAGTARPRPRPRPVRMLGVAAVIVATVLLAQTVFSRHGGTPTALAPASASPSISAKAASQLRRLSSVAVAHTALIPAGQYIYFSSKTATTSTEDAGEAGNENLTTGQSYDLSIKKDVQTWVAPDGSGTRLSTVTQVRFASDEDRQAWQAMGSPGLEWGVGDTLTEDFGPRELTGQLDLSTLPTDPVRLIAVLRKPSIGSGDLNDQQIMSRVATILLQSDPSPALRAAFFKVLADLPGIQALGQVQDPRGRTGLGFMLPKGEGEMELIIDPSTSVVLATLEYDAAGRLRSSIVNDGAVVVSGPHATA